MNLRSGSTARLGRHCHALTLFLTLTLCLDLITSRTIDRGVNGVLKWMSMARVNPLPYEGREMADVDMVSN